MADDDRDRESSDKALDTLAGGLAHELNNIFGIILGNAELASSDARLSPSVRTSIDEIDKAGRQGIRLVQQILAFSRRSPIADGTVEWQRIVHEATRLLRASLPEGIDLEISLVEKGSDARASAARAAAGAATDAVSTTRASRILYLDDEEPMVNLAVRMLGRLGYQATGFVQPEKALGTFAEDPSAFDLVVTDYNMPRISGFQVATEVCRLRPDLPVVVTSGLITDEMKQKAAESGVRYLIDKPDSMDELCRAVARVLDDSSR